MCATFACFAFKSYWKTSLKSFFFLSKIISSLSIFTHLAGCPFVSRICRVCKLHEKWIWFIMPYFRSTCFSTRFCQYWFWDIYCHSLYCLKPHRQISKNGVSKSIVHIIKYANFQLDRVHPEGVIYKAWQVTTNL